MTSGLEYHEAVRGLHPASVALFAALVLPAVLPLNVEAQINGAPASVTSPGFGGRAINGTPPSVTSLGPNGYAPNSRVTFSGGPPVSGGLHDDGHRHRRDRDDQFIGPSWYPAWYPIGVPYAVDLGQATDEAAVDDDDADYRGGPTVFDRRGAGADSYVAPVRDVPRPHSVAAATAPVEETPQIPTVLVFKDGRDVEVGNYAIVGDTLFDLTPGHARRVAIAELDLDATRKKNDDRGVTFALPGQQAN